MKNDSYLVQRLNKPWRDGFRNPFSFGGGLVNGGLSDEAMSLLEGLFSFDYMGAAEFEFGAVPEALNKIANTPNLTGTTFALTDDVDVHTISAAEDVAEVENRVRSWLLPYGQRPHMKESPLLDRVVEGDEWVRTLGWLELDNGWFAFVDKEMYEGVARLFGVNLSA